MRQKIARNVWSSPLGTTVPSPYIVVKREVSEFTAEALMKELVQRRIRGVSLEQDFIRVYPNGSMLCHVVGFMNRAGAGVEGVEREMQQWLSGHDGFRYTERDRTGREMVAFRKLERPARDGSNVRLTIDLAS